MHLKSNSLPGVGWADILALTAGLIVLTVGLGHYGFYEPHEGHFSGVAREMVLRGDWVTPTLNGAPYLNKPPLLYWLIATSATAFGFTEYAARLPLAIAGWCGAIVAWKWSRELWSPTAGRIAAVMLCLALGWCMFTHQILIDVLLSTLLLASFYCIWRLLWEPDRWDYFFALYVTLGWCVLTKGPFGLVFPILAGAGLTLSRGRWAVLRTLRVGRGMAVVLAVVLPWAIAVESANPGFLHYFIFNENLKRIADTRWPPDYDVSKVSALGYLAVTAIWCMPWTLVLPQALYTAGKDWLQGRRSEAALEDQRHSEGLLLLAIAAVGPILLFLPMSSRLIYYSLPALPPLVMLCAGWWVRSGEKSQIWGRRVAAVLFGLVGWVAVSALFWVPSLLSQVPELSTMRELQSLVRWVAIALGLGFFGAGISLWVRRPDRALVSLFLGFAVTYAAVASGFAAFQDFRSSKTLVETANARLGVETLWVFEGSRELGAAGAMSYYLDRKGNHPRSALPVSDSPTLNPSQGRGDRAVPLGWAPGKNNTAYQIVLVLTDSGANRIPPAFPGDRPRYAITKLDLQQLWQATRPVVFVTDFLRQPTDPADPPTLNLPAEAGSPLLRVGPRTLYGNAAAHDLWAIGEGTRP